MDTMRLFILIFSLVGVATGQSLVKGGEHVCTRSRVEYRRERYCAYNTWRGCCVWRYRTVCVYVETHYCCSGWSQSGTSCPNPICSTKCGGNGKCIAPERCSCNQGYNGDTCQGVTCSYQKPCHPGVCTVNSGSSGGATCTCTTGFSLKSDTEGCVTLSTAPVITVANAKLSYYSAMKAMDIYNLTVDASANQATGTDKIWTNLKAFNLLTAEISGILELPSRPLPAKPSYISSAPIGIAQAAVGFELQKRNISITSRTVRYVAARGTVQCVRKDNNKALSNQNPQESVLECNTLQYPNFDYRLDSEDILTLTFSSTSGGEEVITRSGSVYATYNVTGRSASSRVSFYVDHDLPNVPATGQHIFHVDQEITKGTGISTTWQGWTDTLSGMARYNWEIFRLEKIGDELREENQGYLSPLFSREFNHTNGTGIFTLNYTPPSAGVYSLILEAADLSNNSRYIRRFAIYDPVSNITTTSIPLQALSGYANASYQWQSFTDGQETTVVFSWDGHFINEQHVNGGYLGKIQDYPSLLNDPNIPGQENEFKKVVNKDLIDPSSTRTQAAIPNKNGIIKFEVAMTQSSRDSQPSTFIHKGLTLSHTFKIPVADIKDGSFIRLWSRATDVMGNTRVESLLLGFDRNPPDLQSILIKPNTGAKYTYPSVLSFRVSDRQSGIDSIDYRFIELTSGNVSASGTIPANTSQTRPSEILGYSLDDGSSFLLDHNFPINNCWMKVSREEAATKSYQLELTAKNRAMLVTVSTMEVGNLARFKGIGTYQGLANMTVLSTSSGGVRLGWNFTESCYIRQQIELKYWDTDGTEHLKTVHPGATRFDINELQSSTKYNVSLIVIYDLGTSDEVLFEFTTAPATTLSLSSQMSAGGIAGIVFAIIILVLVGVIIFMGMMIRRGRFKRVDAVVVEPIRKTIRRRRDPGGMGYKQYNTGGYDVDDIYMYGGITFEKTPDWEYNFEDLSLGSIIKVGRFARIYKATLYTEGKSKTVVAKTLKDEYNEEDAVLMRAKINFFGTVVGQHSCLLGFVGSIKNNEKLGPIMLLEYCEAGPLKDWLTDNRNMVNDDVIEKLFRFSYDIARGMEYLAGKKIIHMRLAARNILLTGSLEARISGFGPRQGDDDDDEASKRERIPVKWIAPECLDSSKSASEKSDVWSYGITIWEIFSMGQSPYSDVRSRDLPKWLKKGNRLPKPEYSDDLHYTIMKECWALDPVMRPSFSNIYKKIESLYRQSSGDMYYYKK